jgi:hypothetical protein
MSKNLGVLLDELRGIEASVSLKGTDFQNLPNNSPEKKGIDGIVKQFNMVAGKLGYGQDFAYEPSSEKTPHTLTLSYTDKKVRMDAIFDLDKKRLIIRTYRVNTNTLAWENTVKLEGHFYTKYI